MGHFCFGNVNKLIFTPVANILLTNSTVRISKPPYGEYELFTTAISFALSIC